MTRLQTASVPCRISGDRSEERSSRYPSLSSDRIGASVAVRCVSPVALQSRLVIAAKLLGWHPHSSCPFVLVRRSTYSRRDAAYRAPSYPLQMTYQPSGFARERGR